MRIYHRAPIWVLLLLFSPYLLADHFEDLKNLYPNEYQVLGKDLFRSLIDLLDRTTDSPPLCQGRLTLSLTTPIPASDVTAATTVYFVPYEGNKITLYNGTRWQVYNFSEISVAVPATTVRPFDIFAYDSSGTVTLETTNWTNDTTRATALTTVNGIYVKSGTTTRRYLGTARTTSVSGETEDSTSRRLLWNHCNRVPRVLKAIADTNWSYTTATWRSANALTTLGTYRVEYIMGLSLEPVYNEIHLTGAVYNSSNVNVALGIGVNATNANSADLFGGFAIDLAAYRNTISAIYRGLPSVGYTYLQWVEISDAVGTSDWYGPYCVGGNCRSGGMLGEIWN